MIVLHEKGFYVSDDDHEHWKEMAEAIRAEDLHSIFRTKK